MNYTLKKVSMINKKKILAVITARGGSKTIPRKNIIKLNGRPLISYIIKAALKSRLLDEVIVSTDNQEIKKVAERYRVKVPFLRPKPLATDTAKSIDVLIHALKKIERLNRQKYDYVMCLQPTNPLVTAHDIDNSIKLIGQKKFDSVVSVFKLSDFHPAKLKVIKGGYLTNYQLKEKEGTRRQNYPSLYKRNGGIYLTKRAVILKRSLYGKKIAPYLMPAERSIDINDYFDLKLAGFFLKKASN